MRRFDHLRPEFKPYGFTCEIWEGAPMIRPDRHNEIEINFIIEGSLKYLFGGDRIEIVKGQTGLFWATVPHQIIESSGDCKYFVVTLPLSWFLQSQLPDNLVDPLMHGRFLITNNESRFDLDKRLYQSWIQNKGILREFTDEFIHLEIKARLLRLAMDFPEFQKKSRLQNKPHVPFGQGPIGKMEFLASFIAKIINHNSIWKPSLKS